VTARTRLSALDASFLDMETRATPMHIGTVSLFEGDPLRDADGRIRIEEIREMVELRSAEVPRFRQRALAVPFGLDKPVWVDDPDFDVADHVHLTALPAPGTFTELERLTEDLHMQLLDRSRPLWEMWLVDGLADGSVALVEKFHHSLVDGVSAVDVAMVLLDPTPEPRAVSAVPYEPETVPGPLGLVADALVDRAVEPVRFVRALAARAADPVGAARQLAALADAVRTVRLPARHPSSSSLNRPVGRTRQYEVVRLSMHDVGAVRERLAGTLNDVILASVGGGLRALLIDRGEAPDLPVEVLVPVSLRAGNERATLGNRVGAMLVPLPVGETDPARRLAAVRMTVDTLKRRRQSLLTTTLLDMTDHLPHGLMALVRGTVRWQPLINLVVTNVPGPPVPLYLRGARMLATYPICPLGPNLDVAVGIVSYEGEVTLGLWADRVAVPDLMTLVEGIEKSFAELVAAADAVAS
jgi:diacylglycerol O-acyltransferase / wax synthase